MGEARRQYNTFKMADADAIKKICDIYDWDGKGQLDMFYLMDVVYAAGFNVTKKSASALASRRRRARSSPPSMTSLDSSTPPSRPQSAPEPTTTMLSCASSTTRTRTEP